MSTAGKASAKVAPAQPEPPLIEAPASPAPPTGVSVEMTGGAAAGPSAPSAPSLLPSKNFPREERRRHVDVMLNFPFRSDWLPDDVE